MSFVNMAPQIQHQNKQKFKRKNINNRNVLSKVIGFFLNKLDINEVSNMISTSLSKIVTCTIFIWNLH